MIVTEAPAENEFDGINNRLERVEINDS